jgi:hypothetical protein
MLLIMIWTVLGDQYYLLSNSFVSLCSTLFPQRPFTCNLYQPRNPMHQQSSYRFLQFATNAKIDGLSTTNNPDNVSLLQGKLSILQDVVKELHNRQRRSQESEKESMQQYQSTLESVQRRIKESEQLRDVQRESLEDIQQRLMRLREDREREISNAEKQKDIMYQQQLKALGVSSSQLLEKTKSELLQQISLLQAQLEDKNNEVSELSSKLRLTSNVRHLSRKSLPNRKRNSNKWLLIFKARKRKLCS